MQFSQRFTVFRGLVAGARGLMFSPVCLALCATIVACSGDDGDESDPVDNRTFEQQVEDGAEIYGDNCAHCHGDMGQGTEDAPAVVGEGALPLDPPAEREVRDTQFRTAADVYAFASEYMPGDAPMTLSDQEMVDVLAFALFANGVTLDERLSLENAGDVVINPE